MTHALAKSIPDVPETPGVYLMKDATHRIIYVGKALNLKKRLSSYFKKGQKDVKTGILVGKVVSFETIITATEKEALILESNLIKKYRPRYNVILKDDKRYPSLRIDTSVAYPNILVVRKISKDGSLYFGPFSSGLAVKETLKFINRTFKLRKCKQKDAPKRERPCLNYQMGVCLGPCASGVSASDYREMINEVILFLKGKTPDLIRKLKTEMHQAAEMQNFEKAAELRDKMFSLQKTLEKQVVATSDFEDRDVLAIAANETHSMITLLTVRNGFLWGSRSFNASGSIASEEELAGSAIRQYYDESRFIPNEILVSVPMESAAALEEILTEMKGKKVSIKHPVRGEKKRLMEMARQNADKALKELVESELTRSDLLNRLQSRLDLSHFPNRIECFDNSNLYGTASVAGMVVFEEAKPARNAYRKFKIRLGSGPDDYADMREVLQRRFRKKEGNEIFPDLLMVDGGKGQLNIALEVIRELDLDGKFDIISIAKKDPEKMETMDKIFKPNRANPILFHQDQDLLFFLERIRDETHRFAISFHRKKRNTDSLRSILDRIPGIGQKRKTLLFKEYGSIKKIRAASAEEIGRLPGMNAKLAETLSAELSKIPDN